MELDNLWRLLHGLSREQLKQLTQYLTDTGRKLELKLYKRIQKCEEVTAESERRIRGKEFSESSKFYQYRFRLAESIIRIRVAKRKGTVPPLEFIKNAYLSKSPKVGYKMLERKMREALEAEHFRSLQGFYDLMDEMSHYHGIEIPCPEFAWSKAEFQEVRATNLQMRESLQLIRDSLSLNTAGKKAVADRIVKALPSVFTSRTNKLLRLQVLSSVAVLEGKIGEALSVGRSHVEQIKKWPEKYPVSNLAVQLRRLAFDSITLDLRDSAMNHFLELAALSPENLHDEEELLRSRILVGVAIAAEYPTPQIAESTHHLLDNSLEILNSKRRNFLYYSIGLAHFYNGQYQKAIDCISIVKKVPGLPVTWEPKFLVAICKYELGTDDELEQLCQSIRRQVQKQEARFPKVALYYFEKYYRAVPDARRLLLELGYEELKALTKNPDERRASMLLRVHSWFKAKASSTPIRDIIKLEDNAYRMTKIAMGD